MIDEIISSLMLKYIGIDMEAMSSMQEMSPMGTTSNTSSGLWQELLPAKDGKPKHRCLWYCHKPTSPITTHTILVHRHASNGIFI